NGEAVPEPGGFHSPPRNLGAAYRRLFPPRERGISNPPNGSAKGRPLETRSVPHYPGSKGPATHLGKETAVSPFLPLSSTDTRRPGALSPPGRTGKRGAAVAPAVPPKWPVSRPPDAAADAPCLESTNLPEWDGASPLQHTPAYRRPDTVFLPSGWA